MSDFTLHVPVLILCLGLRVKHLYLRTLSSSDDASVVFLNQSTKRSVQLYDGSFGYAEVITIKVQFNTIVLST